MQILRQSFLAFVNVRERKLLVHRPRLASMRPHALSLRALLLTVPILAAGAPAPDAQATASSAAPASASAAAAYSYSSLVAVHAALMIIAWVILPLPIIVVARYMKQRLGSNWRRVHISLAVASAALTAAGLIAVKLDSTVPRPNNPNVSAASAHAVLGIVIAFALVPVQLGLGAVLRNSSATARFAKFVPLVRTAHPWSGLLLCALAAVNAVFGVTLYSDGASGSIAAIVVWLVAVAAGFAAAEWFWGARLRDSVHSMWKDEVNAAAAGGAKARWGRGNRSGGRVLSIAGHMYPREYETVDEETEGRYGTLDKLVDKKGRKKSFSKRRAGGYDINFALTGLKKDPGIKPPKPTAAFQDVSAATMRGPGYSSPFDIGKKESKGSGSGSSPQGAPQRATTPDGRGLSVLPYTGPPESGEVVIPSRFGSLQRPEMRSGRASAF
ncbi:hypothetical protein HDU84_009739 [Entophlyctis sp. JEL0112]|nr:hypothetical protein HDU84_009739 [Entophlyctis sp. JEL0112]